MTSLQAFPLFHDAAPTAVFSSHSRPAGTPPVLHCTLPTGRAVTLQARHAGVLRVAQGGVWLTFSGAGRDDLASSGDHFLARGDSLRLAAGQAVVAELWSGGGAAGEIPACLAWEAAPVVMLRGSVFAKWRAVVGLAVLVAGRFIRPRPGRTAGPQRRPRLPGPSAAEAAPAVRYLPPTCSPG